VIFLEIFREIGLRERDDAVVVRLRTAHHALAPAVLDDAFLLLRSRPVVSVKRASGKVPIELRAVVRNLRLKAVEDFLRRSTGIRRRLEHEWRHGANEDGLRDAVLAVPRDIPDDLASAGRMSDVDGTLQIEMVRHRCQVVGVVVHVVSVARLRRPPMPATIVSDHAKTVINKEHHVRVPVVRR